MSRKKVKPAEFVAALDEQSRSRAAEIAHLRAQLAVKEGLKIDGNTAELDSLDTCPRTLAELLVSCNVDLEIWEVERHEVGSWPVGAKVGGIIVKTPLYRVKAYLRRKVAIAVTMPPVQPVEVTIRQRPARAYKDTGTLKRAVIWPDSQVGYRRDLRTANLDPFHDRRVMDLALQITAYVKPDIWIFLGDGLDLPDWSTKYLAEPEFYETTQPALVEWAWWLGQVRAACPNAAMHYLVGNHDQRLTTANITHLRSAYGLRPADDLDGHPLLSLDRMLGLDSMGITAHGPYPAGSNFWINDNLQAIHGEVVRSGSGATVRAVVDDLRHSQVFGHIHRVEMACKTMHTRAGKHEHMAISVGTHARTDPGIVPAHSSRTNWQNGMGIVEYEEGNGAFDFHPLLICDNRAMYGGRAWEARELVDIVADLERDTKKGWFYER